MRSCAAAQLGRSGALDVPETDEIVSGLLDKLTERGLARPGLVGPFIPAATSMEMGARPGTLWTGCWILSSAATSLSQAFNAVDFHIHELAVEDPDVIRRLQRHCRAGTWRGWRI